MTLYDTGISQSNKVSGYLSTNDHGHNLEALNINIFLYHFLDLKITFFVKFGNMAT